MEKKDTLVLGGHEFTSRFILGSGKFSVDLIKAAVEQGGAQMVTMALRRVEAGQKDNILDYIPKDVTLLPNTSSARNADEAVRIAHLSREVGCGDFIKIEVMRDSKYLLPDNNETIKATEILAKEGFVVLPYMYPDLYAARALADAGAAAIMPLASPIGTTPVPWLTPALLPSCLWLRLSAPTKACRRKISSRSSSTKSTCRSLSTPVSAVRPRPAKPWKWAPLLSWPTPPSLRLATCLSWPKPSVKPSVPAAMLTLPAWAASAKRLRLRIR